MVIDLTLLVVKTITICRGDIMLNFLSNISRIVFRLTFLLICILNSQALYASKESILGPPLAQSITWQNWSENLTYKPSSGDKDYFTPKNYQELSTIIKNAAAQKGKIKVRASGQRHSQPPLVADNAQKQKRNHTQNSDTWIIDLSCYSDLGQNGEKIILNKEKLEVTVNAGVREDELDAFLTANNLMLKTVTAGGFFSIGGMTTVDVHGATVNSTDFPGTVTAYTVMDYNGKNITYSTDLPNFEGYHPLHFHRVSLGALGIVTSVTLKIAERPYKNTLVPSQQLYQLDSEQDFISTYKKLLFTDPNVRVESFYNPYVKQPIRNILALSWHIDKNPSQPILNNPTPAKIETACQYATDKKWGAPLLGGFLENITEALGESNQVSRVRTNGSIMIHMAFDNIKKKMKAAIANNSSMWLTDASRVMFMSYTIPLNPNNEFPENYDKELAVAWQALNVVKNRLEQSRDFILSVPMEFRFMKAGDAIMGASYAKNPNQRFVGIEIIGFVHKGSGANYPQNLLDFFANVECQWSSLGGMPHQGKMYGFYNPAVTTNCKNVKGTAPFNPNYINYLKKKRGNGLKIFSQYQRKIDPYGMYCNDYLKALGVCENN